MSEPTLVVSPHRASDLVRKLAVLWPAGATLMLGAAALFLVGFAAPERIHSAAHDARHSMNFPCH